MIAAMDNVSLYRKLILTPSGIERYDFQISAGKYS
jgi:hypothetical protein